MNGQMIRACDNNNGQMDVQRAELAGHPSRPIDKQSDAKLTSGSCRFWCSVTMAMKCEAD